MPIDPTLVAALEEELLQAQHVKPGGQQPRPERIAAIEEALALHRGGDVPAPAEPENESDVSTDYTSNDDDKVTKARAASEKRKKETADATKADVETADATE